MNAVPNVLISLEERHAENILSGIKRVELRRRSMNLQPGAVVWMYVKVPVGSIVGSAIVKDSHTLAPSSIWKRFGAVSGLTRQELLSYYEGVKKGFVLELEGARRLGESVALDELRRKSRGFHPPQFFAHLSPALLRAVAQP